MTDLYLVRTFSTHISTQRQENTGCYEYRHMAKSVYPFSIFISFCFYFVCMAVLPACVFMYHMHGLMTMHQGGQKSYLDSLRLKL